MMTIQIFLFITFCGVLGLILRRNFLNTIVSISQIIVGINALFGYAMSASITSYLPLYVIMFLTFAFMLFCYAIAMLLIKRRSTLNVDELTELRG